MTLQKPSERATDSAQTDGFLTVHIYSRNSSKADGFLTEKQMRSSFCKLKVRNLQKLAICKEKTAISGGSSKLMTRFELVTSSLPRMRSTD